MRLLRVVGPGRAGGALQRALVNSGEWEATTPLGRGDDLSRAAADVDVLVIATPDAAIERVAQAVAPVASTLVVHLSGACGLDALEPHLRTASVHPLMTMPDADIGAKRLVGAWFALAGDPEGAALVRSLGGRSFAVSDEDRAVYHAAACVASNHVVALLGQVQRLAAAANVPFDAYFDLVTASVDNCRVLGPRAALTGPAARGDLATINAHLSAIGADEQATYEAMVLEAQRLVS